MKKFLFVIIFLMILVVGGATIIHENQTSTEKEGIGIENGISSTDELSINSKDGLNKTETDKIIWRTMARVEEIREYEFTQNITVKRKSRSEIPNLNSNVNKERINLLYEATFIVPENKNALQRLRSIQKKSVAGYYNQRNNSLVIINNSKSINTKILAHELVHALQDQNNLTKIKERSYDESLSWNAVVEGDATYVQLEYTTRCEFKWDCIPSPRRNLNISNKVLHSVIIFPYLQGEEFISDKKSGCWCNINELYNSPPKTTEEIISGKKIKTDIPETPNVESKNITIRTKPITVGRATMSVMVASPEIRGNKRQRIAEQFYKKSQNKYNYGIKQTAGWRGDILVGYSVSNKESYIWKIRFSNSERANKFISVYKDLLKFYNGKESETIWRTNSKFQDNYIIQTKNETVIIYNSETKKAVKQLKNATKNTK